MKIVKVDTKWMLTDKEMFYRFIKEKCLWINLTRNKISYYSNATKMSQAKHDKSTNEYYILWDAFFEWKPQNKEV